MRSSGSPLVRSDCPAATFFHISAVCFASKNKYEIDAEFISLHLCIHAHEHTRICSDMYTYL
ncbi:hypothetical protein BDY21DRAFT_349610 [Lineolata rhizophorae]|uniref:Uncharacterized protein n=1 Tax=Lineolata rhizophorae TaxID=578093 RepID=A0A6A6NVL1_9PEZI|nr:hypothetical protein BDY21DRAFT_349610 [Lineolata rhizophorae]